MDIASDTGGAAMEIRNFQYLLEVYRCRSISKAAQNLFLSQSQLSRVVRSIEEEFGVTIFGREANRITVTSQGELFLQRVAKMMEEYDSLSAPIHPENRIQIAVVKHTTIYRGLARYARSITGPLNLKLYDTQFSDAVTLVKNGEMLMGIVHIPIARREMVTQSLAEQGLRYQTLFPLENVISVRKGHPLLQRKGVCAEDLYRYPLIIMDTGDEYNIFYDDIYAPFFKILNLSRIDKKVNFRDFFALYEFLEQMDGFLLGFAKMPAVPHDLRNGAEPLTLREPLVHSTSEYGILCRMGLPEEQMAVVSEIAAALHAV